MIDFEGTVTLSGCNLSGNYAGFDGGAVYTYGYVEVEKHKKNDIVLGTMTISGCTVTGNSAVIWRRLLQRQRHHQLPDSHDQQQRVLQQWTGSMGLLGPGHHQRRREHFLVTPSRSCSLFQAAGAGLLMARIRTGGAAADVQLRRRAGCRCVSLTRTPQRTPR